MSRMLGEKIVKDYVQRSFGIEIEQYKKLQELKDEIGVPINQIVRAAIERELERYENPIQQSSG